MLIVVLASASAQNKVPKALREKVSKDYAAALQSVAEGKEEPHMDCSAHVQTHRNVAGIGIQEFKTDFYCYDRTDDETQETKISKPYLIRQKYNIAAREYTEEFLLDDKGQLQFYLLVGPDDPKDLETSFNENNRTEVRFYFDAKGSYGYVQESYPGTSKPAKFIKNYTAERAKSIKTEFNNLIKLYNGINFH